MTETHGAQLSTTQTAAGTGRVANITLWILQVMAAVIFVYTGLPKVMADPAMVAGAEAMGLGTVGLYLVGAAELAGAVALLTPWLSGLAGSAFVGLMIGAVITTVATSGLSPEVAFPAGVLVLVAVIAWGRRRRTAELIRLLRR
jgi:uncharacterized membrane protein YphA (DoxX/SURF4 family)